MTREQLTDARETTLAQYDTAEMLIELNPDETWFVELRDAMDALLTWLDEQLEVEGAPQPQELDFNV